MPNGVSVSTIPEFRSSRVKPLVGLSRFGVNSPKGRCSEIIHTGYCASFRTIAEINQEGRTVLLVEQNARSALAIAQHAVVMEGGVVRMRGTGSDLLEDPEVARLYLGTAGASIG